MYYFISKRIVFEQYTVRMGSQCTLCWKGTRLRSFIAGAPTEWNKLPQAIRTIESISGFRKQLKTYLVRLAYPPP